MHAKAYTNISYVFRLIKPQNVQQALCKDDGKNRNKRFIKKYPNT